MESVRPNKVFRQYLSLLPQHTSLSCPLANYQYEKMTDQALLKIMIMSELCQWDSLRSIAFNVRPSSPFKRELDLESISSSQLSRRLRTLSTAALADILGYLARKYWILQRQAEGLIPKAGILRIIDSTYVKLPQNAANWTAVSALSSGIKLHTRLAMASADSMFPEKMIPSTGNIADVDAVNHLIEKDSALYVMDRGYGHKTKMGGWMEQNIDFLVRVRFNFRKETLRSITPTLPNVLKFETISIRKHRKKLRYVEFVDEKDNHYHLVTSRLDLSEEEILETYKDRWYIELFFKWIKQHLKVIKLHSHSPIGIWNQIFIKLITYALVEIFRLMYQPGKPICHFLQALRAYLFYPLTQFVSCLNRKLRKSKGRQKLPEMKPKPIQYGEDFAIVQPITKEHFLLKQLKRKEKKS